MTKDPKIFLGHILECIDMIEEYVDGWTEKDFLASKEKQDAVIRRFEIIGEATKHLPKSLLEKHHETDWQDIMSMRDRLTHEYFRVMMDIVWQTIKQYLPSFRREILKMIK
ncbi:MAG: DUF86 domain-containing protein [Patescibacteria group bacterium]